MEGEEYAAMMRPSIAVVVLGLLPPMSVSGRPSARTRKCRLGVAAPPTQQKDPARWARPAWRI
jgi:hypothetical protein